MSADVDSVRDEVRAWLAENWNAEARQPRSGGGAIAEWLGRVLEAGWAVPSWPARYWGRGLGKAETSAVTDEFRRVGAPGAGQDRTNITANSIMQFGSEALKRRLIPEFLRGAVYCLLYSEPGAGSDLAAVRTRADRAGEVYTVTGQKVWTSGAHKADYGLLLARTDWEVPKHQGLSFFVVPMRQPGIEVRPIHQITGDVHFNEVFLDGAQVPAENLVGNEGDGWKVLQTALAVERMIMGEGAGERRQGSFEDNAVSLIDIAREAGKLDQPVMRQEIAQAMAYRQLNTLNMVRAKQEMAQGSSSPIMSLGKLAMSRILHNDARVMTKLLGAQSMLNGDDNPGAADVNYRTANAYMTSIGGGTDQIQRNIIGERVLGLPRESEADRNIPFRQSRAVTG